MPWKGHLRKFKVNASTLRYAYMSQTLIKIQERPQRPSKDKCSTDDTHNDI